MNQGLIWLADNLRISYGDGGILALMKMVMRASQVFPLMVMGRDVAGVGCDAASDACVGRAGIRFQPMTG